MKVRGKELPEKQRIEVLDTLYTAAAGVKGREAMKLFLRDLLTPSERIMLGRRIVIARRLIAGESYDKIESDMRVGRDTIWRIQRWLFDQLPGFEEAIKELEREMKTRQFKKQYAQSAMFRLKKKYPGHFLLFPTPKSKNSEA
ncbi:MAG TPA: Trp family transcriptional regulator [Candidatus Paceibacterota bacterium]|nr:Trp family transcriptional regulator [Candidatus Paceibacterota bacterium]